MSTQAGRNSFLVRCHIKGDEVNLIINIMKVSDSAFFPISKHVNKISKTVKNKTITEYYSYRLPLSEKSTF